MDINELTIGNLKELKSLIGMQDSVQSFFEVNKAYLIRTVTHYHIGMLTGISPQELRLENASWIPDTGRLQNTLEKGVPEEVEMIGTVIVSRGAIVDAMEWKHPLPSEQK